jgi:phenylacetate-CoA ligase
MSTERGKVAPVYDPARLKVAGADARRALLAAINAAPDSFYATRAGFPFTSWDSVPILSGNELAAEIDAHPPFGRLQVRSERLLRAGLATAAVPRPVPMCWSVTDLENDARLGARSFWRAGLRPRGRTSDCLDGGLVTPGTLAITDALDAIDALALPVGPLTNDTSLARAREVWRIVQPQLLITTLDTFTFLQQQREAPDAIQMLILTPHDSAALAAASQANVFRVLSIPIVATFVAGECHAHNGLHVAEDDIVAEIVDARGLPLPDGAPGRLVLSTVRRSHAIVRLDTALRATLDRAPCRCEEPTARLRIG